MLNLAGPCQQLLGGQPLSNESMNINLDIDNLDFIHLDFHHLETLVHKLPNSRTLLWMEDIGGVEDTEINIWFYIEIVLESSGVFGPPLQRHATICGELHGSL